MTEPGVDPDKQDILTPEQEELNKKVRNELMNWGRLGIDPNNLNASGIDLAVEVGTIKSLLTDLGITLDQYITRYLEIKLQTLESLRKGMTRAQIVTPASILNRAQPPRNDG